MNAFVNRITSYLFDRRLTPWACLSIWTGTNMLIYELYLTGFFILIAGAAVEEIVTRGRRP
ncbi:hypothetical protein [Sinimarinibacterium sp. NLF-5-8]|uniref:hypothetical protein n=1 Tax=Sinimarinibacterium sp. NLF-5-8 TaxID=2698684 RepID=UPI00137BAE61|nr:hypothetical protein [Sinimarinibacterium sp. NLF-5-8]QHS09153.1 hypothetical protein GT972_02600 [Sinimarinibacterium sp. NLF-5-8]